MVLAILDNRKTQTRRVVKPQPPAGYDRVAAEPPGYGWQWQNDKSPLGMWTKRCPYGVVGDRLWVRETWAEGIDSKGGALVVYRADGTAYHMLCENCGEGDPVDHGWRHYPPAMPVARWRQSIFMKRWACRIVLEITGIRVERVSQICRRDAIAEGIQGGNGIWKNYDPKAAGEPDSLDPIDSYRTLWDSINGARGFAWDTNPWVWVVEFRRVEA